MECAGHAVIRQVEERDESEMKRLFTLYCQETHQTGDVDIFWRGIPRVQHGVTLVGEHDDHLYGFLTMANISMAVAPYKAVMGQIAFTEPSARHGVAILLRAGVKWAKSCGINRIFLCCREQAMAHWRKHAFVPRLVLMERVF